MRRYNVFVVPSFPCIINFLLWKWARMVQLNDTVKSPDINECCRLLYKYLKLDYSSETENIVLILMANVFFLRFPSLFIISNTFYLYVYLYLYTKEKASILCKIFFSFYKNKKNTYKNKCCFNIYFSDVIVIYYFIILLFIIWECA